MTTKFHEITARPGYNEQIDFAYRMHPATALLGPRQCGKTTLAKIYADNRTDWPCPPQNYFDLEDTTALSRLSDPMLTLSSLEGLIVIDEIQRRPDLFPTLRVLIDNKPNQRYLILGSASRDLIQQSSETLAGRIAYIEVTPFSYNEVGSGETLWLRGGFPKAFLAETDAESFDWRKNYIRSYLEIDLPYIGVKVPPANLHRFWMMLAHYHANIFNASEIGCSLGLNHKTIQHYADILSGTFMIRQLMPWYENIGKRQVKSRKIYFRDSGILHNLLDIADKTALLLHPKLGASWEGFALEQIIRYHRADPEECYFWAVHNQAELDLLLFKNGKRLGFEFKYTSMPSVTSSMKIAIDALNLDSLTVIYPGCLTFPLTDKITAYGLQDYLSSPG